MPGHHILITEDEAHARLSLSLILKKAGYQVSTAENGSKALALVTKLRKTVSPITLLLTDIRMPVVNGLELIDGLRKKGIEIPVIAITAYKNENMVQELRRRGCEHCLDKPFLPEEVVSQVGEVLNKG